ncbi:MAG: hypothetical protein H6738_10045 [Alphaproteobacteria bacterium]|nr:hypothetical protein [Alphaproteobacteria bacterium]
MALPTVAEWDPALRARVGASLADRLRPRLSEADAVARGLAPDGPGPGRRFHDYGETLAPSKRTPYQGRFEGPEELLALLDEGHPGAIELGLEVLSRLDPEACVAPAEALLALRPWNDLGGALGRALGRCASERSFRLLVDHADAPYLRSGLARNGWPGGVDEAWALVRAVDWSADVEPRTRDATLPAFGYLLRHDRERAFPAVVALLASRDGQLWASHALFAIEPEGRDVLVAELARAAPGERLGFAREHAVKVLLERDPLAVVDALGGEAFLLTPGGRPRLAALLDQLRTDTWNRRSEGGPRGWLAADPAFARLCVALKGDPDRSLAALARDLVGTLPKELRPRVPRAPKRVVPVQVGPDPALVERMERTREQLDRLVAHLRTNGYRFAAPKQVRVPPRSKDLAALKRLEKLVVVPPALSAFWRIVGSVDLRGQHPSWPVGAWLGFPGQREPVWTTDPLVVAPAADVIAEALEEHPEPPMLLSFAPDDVGKAGWSGGSIGVWLPQDAADPALEGADGTWSTHLDQALAWAGFPGFAAIDDAPLDWIEAARAAM